MTAAEQDIEQDRLHLVSATDMLHMQAEMEHPEENQASGPQLEENPWTADNPDLIIPEQRATCVYTNKFDAIVIRQERAWNEDDDSYIFVHPQHVDALVEKLMQCKAACEQAIKDARK